MATGAEYDVGDDVARPAPRDPRPVSSAGSTFGNARYVRNLLEAAIGRHAWRLRDVEAADPRAAAPARGRRPRPGHGRRGGRARAAPAASWSRRRARRRLSRSSSGKIPLSRRRRASRPTPRTSPRATTTRPPPPRRRPCDPGSPDGPGVPTAPASQTDPASQSAPASFSEDVPRLLNRLQVLAVAACVLFAVLDRRSSRCCRWQANGRAADNTEQLVRVQKIQSSLLRADALATNAFLVGGLEPAAAAGGVRRRDRRRAAPDHRRGRGPARRPGGPGRPQRRGTRPTRPPSPRPATTTGRTSSVGIAYLNSASDALRFDAAADRPGPGRRQLRAGRRRDGRPAPLWLLLLGAARAGRCCGWSTASSPRRFRRRLNVGVGGRRRRRRGADPARRRSTPVARGGDNDAPRDGPYRSAVAGGLGPHRRQRRQGQREPGPDQPRLRPGLRGRLGGRGATSWSDNASPADPAAVGRLRRAVHDEVVALDDAGQWDDARLAGHEHQEERRTDRGPRRGRRRRRAGRRRLGRRGDRRFRSGGNTCILLLGSSPCWRAGGRRRPAAWGINQRRREYA